MKSLVVDSFINLLGVVFILTRYHALCSPIERFGRTGEEKNEMNRGNSLHGFTHKNRTAARTGASVPRRSNDRRSQRLSTERKERVTKLIEFLTKTGGGVCGHQAIDRGPQPRREAASSAEHLTALSQRPASQGAAARPPAHRVGLAPPSPSPGRQRQRPHPRPSSPRTAHGIPATSTQLPWTRPPALQRARTMSGRGGCSGDALRRGKWRILL